jgi:predicted dehydrogenase
MQNKINLGIIGKNFGYNVIYKSFSKNKKYKVKAFCFKTKKYEKIKVLKGIKIYSSWRKLILDKKINAIAIATPPKLHKDIIKFAIKNNKHVFCEKPFTRSYKEATSICDLIKKKKHLSHMVNYEFGEIDAFNFFREKVINNIKVKKVYVEWYINIKKRLNDNWKENPSKGGGIIYNYVCHSIYYLEFLLGKINSVKVNISQEKKRKTKFLKGTFFFNSGLIARIDIKVGAISKKIKPIHQIRILSKKKNYLLKTDLNSLADKFKLITFDNKSNKKENNLFKIEKNKSDFRIKPTFINSKKFAQSILKGKNEEPSFFKAKRIHLIIDKMLDSSKKNKKIFI